MLGSKDMGEKTQKKYFFSVGRRKTATAVVKLVKGKQDNEPFVVNGMPIEQYWPHVIDKVIWQEPFRTTNTLNQFTGTAIVKGSGKRGQLGAFSLAVSRALEVADKEKFRPILKKRGLLTRDARAKERRKAGLAQKARAKKQSPRR